MKSKKLTFVIALCTLLVMIACKDTTPQNEIKEEDEKTELKGQEPVQGVASEGRNPIPINYQLTLRNNLLKKMKKWEECDPVLSNETKFLWIDMQTLEEYLDLLKNVESEHNQSFSGIRIYLGAKNGNPQKPFGKNTFFMKPTVEINFNDPNNYENMNHLPVVLNNQNNKITLDTGLMLKYYFEERKAAFEDLSDVDTFEFVDFSFLMSSDNFTDSSAIPVEFVPYFNSNSLAYNEFETSPPPDGENGKYND